jgi:hypothetical protein
MHIKIYNESNDQIANGYENFMSVAEFLSCYET